MKYYFAPLEGVAGYIYRKAHYDYFKGVDKYFSPFLTTRQTGIMKKKEMRDILPENNEGISLVPQLLSNRAADFCLAANQIKEMGYHEVNLNLGCPSGTVTGKGRGSGFLKTPEALDTFLDEIYTNCDMDISIKTRIGFSEPEEFYTLIEIFNKYPIYELTIHPRTRTEMYKGNVHYEIFENALRLSKNPLCYNGDIKTVEDCKRIEEEFAGIEAVMMGRGMIRNPNLIGDITGRDTMDKRKLREFLDRLYSDYSQVLDGERSLLFKMKEIWLHMGDLFEGSEKYLKKIKKTQHLSEYHVMVDKIFKELTIV